jgi:hypothetical protein
MNRRHFFQSVGAAAATVATAAASPAVAQTQTATATRKALGRPSENCINSHKGYYCNEFNVANNGSVDTARSSRGI